MPAYYGLPAAFENASVEDAAKFSQLPFYLVKSEIKQFPRWNIYDQLYGSIPWEPNMGDTMRGVTPQPSPVGESFFFPKDINTLPDKNVYETTESTENAKVKWHRYESKQFSFVPYFQAFWRDHIQYTNKDIVRQIQVSNNMFLRTQLFFKAPYVYLAGTGLTAAPTADGNAAGNAANSKTTAWIAAQIANVKNNLTLRTLYRATLTHREDLGAPAFEGIQNMPTDNEGLKGKWVIVGSTEAWDMFPFDADAHLLKSINLDLLFKDFNGLLFGKLTYKFDPFPLRFKLDGTPVPAQIYNQADKKCWPNPDYTNIDTAPIEVAWCLAADAIRSIKVGPPPREFAAQKMDAKKFYSMRWNGEVQLTDQILIQYPDGKYDLNRYGTQLQFISAVTHGAIAGESRYAVPIFFQRKRAPELA